MLVADRLSRLANIRPGEGKVVAWVLLYAVVASATDLLGNTAAYALFLNEFDAQSLPYIYISGSIVTTLLSVIYLRLSQRYSLAQLLIGQFSFILLTLIGYRVGLAFMPRGWFIFSLPIWDSVVNTLSFTAFWNLLGRLFNLQQGKRLFSLLGAGQQIAIFIVGFLIPGVVRWVGTPNLLVVAAVGGIVTLGILIHITRNFSALHTLDTEEVETEGETPRTEGGLLSDSYIRLIFGMYIFFALGSLFIDNIFFAQIENHLTDQDQMAGFLGTFSGVVGGLSLFSQMFLASRVLSRYGVRTAILLTPILLLFGAFLMVITGTFSQLTLVLFWLAVSLNLTRQVMDASDNTAANLLYQPLPAALRTRAQTTVDGIIYPCAVGLAGLILVGLTNILHLTALQLAYVLLPILIGWAAVAFALGRLYPKRVQQALRQRIIQGNSTFQADRASLELLQQSLTSPHPGVVIYALNMLEEFHTETLAHLLPRLLTHADSAVRLDALERLERLGETTALPAIEHCFRSDPDNHVRSVALRTLASIGNTEQFEEVYNYLDTPDPQLRQGVMIGLLRSGELEGILAVSETLAQLVNSPNMADRIFAAQVLGQSGVASFYRPLRKLLSDAEPAVQRAALAAAGHLKHPKLWPVVVAALATPKTRSAAQAALVAGGEATLVYLKAAFAQAGQQHQLWIELVRTCGRIRSPQAVALLLPHLNFPHLQVRSQLLAALSYTGYQADTAVQPLVEQQIQAELAHAAWSLASLVDLGEEPALALVRTALENSLAQQRMRLFLWLALLYDASTIQRTRDALGLALGVQRELAAEQRAYALETLDGIVANLFKQNLLALLDDLPPAPMLARLANDFAQPTLNQTQRLCAIITSSEAWVTPWTQAIALYAATALVKTSTAPQLLIQKAAMAAHTASSALVVETATWALATLDIENEESTTEKLAHTGGHKMLLTIEKVMILKTVDIFAATPDEILVDIAALLKEIEAPPGTTIFEKGSQGDSMYLIVEGEVEARDGDHVFARMGERQVFGEMALLDGEPRTASICTTQATRLLRLDQEPFYELMDDRIEVARGIIHVLLQRLRLRTNDVNKLQAKVNKLERATNRADEE